jgi:5-methyltetrahydrofolate--homocysteine methyltransferase
MELAYKPDFPHARRQWERYWAGELTDRPMMSFELVRPGGQAAKAPTQHEVMTDPAAAAEKLLAWADSREFLGGAMPACIVQFAPDHLALMVGASMRQSAHSGETAWIDPFVDDWDACELRFDPHGWAWQRTAECIGVLRARCDGKVLICGPNLQGGLDCLSAVRGPERLAMDLVECPEKIERALHQVDKAFADAIAAIAAAADTARWGMVTRHGMYSSGTINVPQCDFSCMISPAMFRQYGLPSVRHEAGALTAAEYHLDGPDAIKHLEAICEVPGIKAIQWQPGDGNAARQDWSGLLKRIDSLGKGLVLWGDVQSIPRMYRELTSDYLYFRGLGVKRDEALRLLEEVPGCRRRG